MIRLTTPIDGLVIQESVANTVIPDTLSHLGLMNVKYYIDTTKNNKYWNMPGSKSKPVKRDVSHRLDEVVYCKIEETPMEEITVEHEDLKKTPLINDRLAEITVRPVYIETEYKLSLDLKSKSENFIQNVISRIQTRLSTGRDVVYHDIHYKFCYSDFVMDLMQEAFDRRRKVVEPEDQLTFEEYMITCIDERTQTLAGIGNGKYNICAVENQLDTVGIFPSEAPERKIDYDEDTGYYSIIIDYIYRMDKPEYLYVQYPIVVYNQSLSSRYLVISDNRNDLRLFNSKYETYGQYFISLKRDGWKYQTSRIPDYDNYLHNMKYNGRPLLEISLGVTKEDRRFLINLNDLGEYAINSDLIDYLTKNRDVVVRLGENYTYPDSVIYIILLVNGELSSIRLIIDEDLNIWSSVDLDLTSKYHIAIVSHDSIGSLSAMAWRLYDLYYDLLACLGIFLDRGKRNIEAPKIIMGVEKIAYMQGDKNAVNKL